MAASYIRVAAIAIPRAIDRAEAAHAHGEALPRLIAVSRAIAGG
jgi:hypothetical protein